MDTTQIVINLLLFGGFCVTAFRTFRDWDPFAAFSMFLSLVILFLINP